MAATFKLHIRSADEDFYEGDCSAMTVRLSDGEMGLLANHSAMAAAVVPGFLFCRLPDGTTLNAVSGSGLLRFEKNDALLLLDSVERLEDIDVPRARDAAARAREALKASRTRQERLQAESDLARAESRLRAAGEEF